MSSNQDLQKRRDAALARGQTNLLPVFVEKAENAELWDVAGRRYIDFAGGIAVLNTGHVHPRVRAAVEELEREITRRVGSEADVKAFHAVVAAIEGVCTDEEGNR